jgi:hypothetical protein
MGFLWAVCGAVLAYIAVTALLFGGPFLPTFFVGIYGDFLRHGAVLAFGADEVEEHSFFRSLREAPQDFQFFLHTAALKNCTPYAWSYRTMAYYRLGPSVAGNVVPRQWIARCSIPEPGYAR